VPLVDGVISDALPDQMVADGPALQAVLVEDVPARLHVAVIFERLVHFKVVAPAGQLQTIEAPLAGFLCNVFEGQVSPLASEEGNGSCHDVDLLRD
jgi:hypothetical protein